MTLGDACERSSTRRSATPASTTAWMFSLGPSERCESAQHASVNTYTQRERDGERERWRSTSHDMTSTARFFRKDPERERWREREREREERGSRLGREGRLLVGGAHEAREPAPNEERLDLCFLTRISSLEFPPRSPKKLGRDREVCWKPHRDRVYAFELSLGPPPRHSAHSDSEFRVGIDHVHVGGRRRAQRQRQTHRVEVGLGFA